jgi:hypothetical protein
MSKSPFLSLAVAVALVMPASAANLLTNGDFEQGDTGQLGVIAVPGWLNWGQSGWHHDDAGRTIGTKAIVFWWDDAGLWQDVPVIPGRDYEFSVKVFNWSGNPCTWNGLMRAEFYTSTGGKLLEVQAGKYYAATDPKDEWVLLTGVVTAPANAATGRMVLNLTDWFDGVGGVLNFDDASITLVAEQGQIYVSPALINVAKGDGDQAVNVQIPAECNATQDVQVTLSSDAPDVASPVGGTNGSIELTFLAGQSNEQYVDVHFGSVGTATLTAAGCDALPGTATAHVFDLTAIDLDVPYDLMLVGRTQQATATGTFGDAGTRDVSGSVSFAVDPPSGALSVDAGGVITAVALGTAHVTASQNGVVSQSWEVQVVTPPAPEGIEIAGSGLLLVDLAATDPTAGQAAWVNKGSLRDFAQVGTPVLENVAGEIAVSFDATSAYQGPLAPVELRGGQARTIEVWAYDAEIPAGVETETMVAWGHRGGPDGTNLQFGFGDDPGWGAVSHWNPDMPWYSDPPLEGNYPPLGQWDHLVYVYDPLGSGSMKVYINGVQTNLQAVDALATHPGHINLAAPNESERAMDLTDWQRGALSLAVVRIHDGALTDEQVAKNYRRGISRPVNAGDMDLDGDVDQADLAAFLACAQGPAIPVAASWPCSIADFDGDGDADQDDFGVWQHCYSGDGVPVAPGCK